MNTLKGYPLPSIRGIRALARDPHPVRHDSGEHYFGGQSGGY
jgi:hypothetical protein